MLSDGEKLTWIQDLGQPFHIKGLPGGVHYFRDKGDTTEARIAEVQAWLRVNHAVFYDYLEAGYTYCFGDYERVLPSEGKPIIITFAMWPQTKSYLFNNWPFRNITIEPVAQLSKYVIKTGQTSFGNTYQVDNNPPDKELPYLEVIYQTTRLTVSDKYPTDTRDWVEYAAAVTMRMFSASEPFLTPWEDPLEFNDTFFNILEVLNNRQNWRSRHPFGVHALHERYALQAASIEALDSIEKCSFALRGSAGKAISYGRKQTYIMDSLRPSSEPPEQDYDEDEEDNDEEFVVVNGEAIPKDHAIWCEYGDAWEREDDAVYSDYYDAYATWDYAEDNWVWCEYGESWVEIDDAVSVHGTNDKATRRYAGRNFIWSDYYEEFFFEGDLVYCEHDDEYYMYDDIVMAIVDGDGNREPFFKDSCEVVRQDGDLFYREYLEERDDEGFGNEDE